MISERRFLSDVGAETERRRGMLSVLVGPRIALEIDCLPGAGLIRLEPVDLGRILVNLVRNAGEAMPGGGRVRISVQKGAGLSFVPGVVPWVGHDLVPALRARDPLLPRPGAKGRSGDQTVLLCVQDNGPGIDPGFSSPIFSACSTKLGRQGCGPLLSSSPKGRTGLGLPLARRGLGLGIVRSLVESADGQLRVVSRPGGGTRFEIEFPLASDRSRRNDLSSRSGPDAGPVKISRGSLRQGPLRPFLAGARVEGYGTEECRPDRGPAPPASTPNSPSRQSDEQEGSRVQC